MTKQQFEDDMCFPERDKATYIKSDVGDDSDGVIRDGVGEHTGINRLCGPGDMSETWKANYGWYSVQHLHPSVEGIAISFWYSSERQSLKGKSSFAGCKQAGDCAGTRADP